MRVFISINIPENVKKEIKKIQERLLKFYCKKTETENLHLTLKFLGEIDREKIELVKERLKEVNIKKFEIMINFIGVFDNRKSRKYARKIIIWLNLTNCDELQKKIDKSLTGLFEAEKRFMGHLTIARAKSIEHKKEFLEKLNKIKIPKIKFEVDKFYLMNSILSKKGPRYEVIERYNLI